MLQSMLIPWTFACYFVFCELGERVAIQFELFDVELNRCGWNKLPIEMRRMYMIFLSGTQQPANIRSYGSILCTRETFKRVNMK